MPLTLAVTRFPEPTWRGLAYLAAGLCTFATLVAWVDRPARVWLAALGLVGVALLLAVASPFVVRWNTSATKVALLPAEMYGFMDYRAGDPVNPNVLAGTLALLLPLPWAWLLLGKETLVAGLPSLPRVLRRAWAWRLLVALVGLALLVVLVLSKCRGAYVATGVALLALLIAWRRWAALGLVVVLEGVALVWTRVGATGIVSWLVYSPDIHHPGGRPAIWALAWQMLRDFPLTGVGLNTFPQVADALYGRHWVESSVTHAHNLWLQVGVDLGVIGLLAYTALWGMCMLAAWRAFGRLRRASEPELAALAPIAAGLGAGLVAMGVHGLVDAVTWGIRPAVIAWALMGLAWAVGGLSRHDTFVARPGSSSGDDAY